MVFMLPFLDTVIAGTTDTACPVTDRPVAQPDEVTFILEALGDHLGIQVGSVACVLAGVCQVCGAARTRCHPGGVACCRRGPARASNAHLPVSS